MAEFTIRSDQIDVEQIMRQIRARIKEKRGVDYTEQEIRELASVKLEQFLDPRALRSDLLKHYREQRPAQPLPTLPPHPPTYAFDEDTIYASHRGPLRWVRKLLNPLLKLLFNPNPLIQVLHLQGEINEYQLRQYAQQFDRVSERLVTRDELNYELLHNLVLELTRLGIEVKNLKMRVESLSTRLDFSERRARALESLVQFKPGAAAAPDGGGQDQQAPDAEAAGDAGHPGKRRRRRRGRRRGPGEGAPSPADHGGEDGAMAEAPGDTPHSTPEPRPVPPGPDSGTDQ
jgi:hypothetical protein